MVKLSRSSVSGLKCLEISTLYTLSEWSSRPPSYAAWNRVDAGAVKKSVPSSHASSFSAPGRWMFLL